MPRSRRHRPPDDASQAAWPVAVRLVDIDGDPDDLILADAHGYRTLLAIGRSGHRPVGATLLGLSDRPSWRRAEVRDSLIDSTSAATERLLPPAAAAAGIDARDSDVSIVVPTIGGDIPELVACVRHLVDQELSPLEIIVVDNRPTNVTVHGAITDVFGADPRVRLVEESRRGLAAARNAGLRAARGAFVAFVDDDVRADPSWLAWARERFEEAPDIACVTGLIIPAELENQAQWWFDRFAGFGKGFEARTYRLADPPEDEPLFPYTPGRFGSGANAIFRRRDLETLGGYDTRLGAGTSAAGGEDIDMYFRVVTSGRALSYEPAAIVWHRHPRTFEEVREHIFTYGIGLGASLTKQVLSWRTSLDILRRMPAAIRYLIHPQSQRNARKGEDFPHALTVLELIGIALGPVAYLRSCWTAAALSRRRSVSPPGDG